jgi:hypothetical protein
MRNTRRWLANFDGSSGTYAANGIAKVALLQLAGQSATGRAGIHTLLGGLYFTGHYTISNASGGSIVAGWRKMHDFVRRVTVGSTWKWFDFPFYGGQALRVLRRNVLGRNPQRNTNSSSISNSGTFVVQLDYFLPFMNPGARSPSDLFYPARGLKDVNVEMQFANGAAGGEFGSGVSISSGALDECTAVLIDKTHFRVPPKWSWIERKLSGGINDSTSLPSGHKYCHVGLFELQSPSGGYTDSFFATTDVTKVEYTEDAEMLCRGTHPRQLIGLWNEDQSRANAVDLPFIDGQATDAGTPTSDYIPVKQLSRSMQEGYVQGDVTGSSPVWAITGPVTTANCNILAHYVDPTTEDDLVRGMQDAGVQPSNAMLASTGTRTYSRGHSDTDSAMSEADAQFVPQRLKPNG